MGFKENIQMIKNSYNIVDYVRMNGVDLKESGASSWSGLCPFHSENTPSFFVNEDFQNYKCFGCGESGDIFSFAQHIHTVSFGEAMRMLAEEKGIKLSFTQKDESAHDINGIRNVISDAQDFFRANYMKLDDSHPAKREILKRNLDINNELYGYSLEAPNELYKYLKSKGHSDENIKNSQLVLFYDNRAPWDFFHGRLMITLSDYLGRPVSFTSRKIYEDDRMKAKYVNGKESPVFIKKSILFGADVAKRSARKNKEIYVVEGQFDQIAMVEHGMENVVATSGTAFSDDHANLLLRMVGPSGKVIFIMDGDEAGMDAAASIFTSHSVLHSRSYAVHLEDGKDPCDYIIDGGIDSLKEKVEEASTLHDFMIDYVISKLGGSLNVNNRQQFVAEVARYAKHSEDSYVVESMLNKASVISAMSIDNVKSVYKNTEVNKRYVRKEEKSEPKKLNLKIQLNADSEADKCMFSALALLVRMPDELIKCTPKNIHKKFRPFLRELNERYNHYKSRDEKWRFISEDYTDSDFATTLQDKNFLVDPREDIEASVSQYKYLFNKANDIYKREYENMRRAKALSSVIDSNDPKEIAEALRLYKKSQ